MRTTISLIITIFTILTYTVSAQQTINFESASQLQPPTIVSSRGVNIVDAPACSTVNWGTKVLRFTAPSSYILFGPTTAAGSISFDGIYIGNGQASRNVRVLWLNNTTFSSETITLGNNTCQNVSTNTTIPAGSYVIIMRQAANDIVMIDNISISNGALPVELVSFSATERNGYVSLRWETATETNNYGFDIMKSRDSINWSTIGFVVGNGTKSSATYYNYSDKNTVPGKSFYRLKQVDRDGTFDYSNVVMVNVKPYTAEFNVDVYPNPMGDVSIFNTFIAKETTVRVEVLNALGQVITVLYDGSVSYATISGYINLASYPSGSYYVRVMTPTNNVITMVNKY